MHYFAVYILLRIEQVQISKYVLTYRFARTTRNFAERLVTHLQCNSGNHAIALLRLMQYAFIGYSPEAACARNRGPRRHCVEAPTPRSRREVEVWKFRY